MLFFMRDVYVLHFYRIYPRAMDGWKEAMCKKEREAMSMKSLLAEAVAGWLASN